MLNAVDMWVTIGAVNLDRLVTFYGNLLGKSPVKDIPGVYAEFHCPALKLGLFAPKSPDPLPPSRPPSMGMTLCFEVTDLEAAIAHLTALGYPPLGSIIHATHGQEIYAYDPEGNGLILHQSAN